MFSRLSELTPAVVDDLYNITGARPPTGRPPPFLFLVGVPGAGKSSGHAYAIEKKYLQAGNYVTANLDTLLESLTPFRAASAIAHLLEQEPTLNLKPKPTPKPTPPEHKSFSTIFAYGTRKENMGLFKWYNTHRDAFEAKEPALIHQLNRVREEFRPLQDVEGENKLVDKNEEALRRAIAKGVDIVYETTFSLTKGRVTKVEKIMKEMGLEKSPYRIIIVYIGGTPEEVVTRVRMRQQYQMPYQEKPFFRRVPADKESVANDMDNLKKAVKAVVEQYDGRIELDEGFINMLDPARLPAMVAYERNTQLKRILDAYGPEEGGAAAGGAAAGGMNMSGGSRKHTRKAMKRRPAKTRRHQRRG